MKTYSNEELSQHLSLYLDGMLQGEELRQLEEHLASDAAARKELEGLRRMKHLLASKPPVVHDPYFWTRLAATLESERAEEENLLPFPRKYVPLASALGIMAFVAIGLTLFLQRGPLIQYLSERSHAVQQAYETNVLKGSVMPLFSHIDNDRVLQFALFGTLPLDAKAETALRVDAGSEQGYRIEVGMAAKRHGPAVTVKDLYSEVRPTHSQAQLIDSVLQEARGQIEKGAFYAENNALAIDPALTRLNRSVLSNIAAVLAPVQRVRFDKFLNTRNATYVVAENEVRAPAVEELEMRELRRLPRPSRYIVVTPDSLMVTALALNIDSLLESASASGEVPMIPEISMRLEQLMRSHFDRRVVKPTQAGNSRLPVRMENQQDFFKIEFGPQLVSGNTGAVRVWVTPRARIEKTFRFEHRAPGVGVNVYSSPENGINVKLDFEELDSMIRAIQQQQFKGNKQFHLLDSLMQMRARKMMDAQRPMIIDSSDIQ